MTASVDIVLRTKDRPVFVERALRSIGQQTFTDWRIIVVNDGGDAATLESVIASAGLTDRVLVLHHDTSHGRWPSANHGVREADAPLLVLHDDDDAWHPDFLRRGVDYLAEHEDAPGVVGRIEIVWESVEGDRLVEQRREVFQPQLTAPFLGDVLLFNRFVPIGFLYRREIHEVLGEYREDLAVVGDWDFNRKVLTRWPLEYLGDDVLAYWYQRPGVQGTLGNSVIAEERNHRHYDKWIRDAHLREHVQRDGDGDLLYLTKFVDQRIWDLEHHADHLAGADADRVAQVGRDLDAVRHEVGTMRREILESFERSRSLSSRVSGVWRRISGNPRT